MGWQESHKASTTSHSTQTEDYYLDAETAEYAEMLRTRPEMRMLFSASRGISKEDMEKAVEYIELLKLKHK